MMNHVKKRCQKHSVRDRDCLGHGSTSCKTTSPPILSSLIGLRTLAVVVLAGAAIGIGLSGVSHWAGLEGDASSSTRFLQADPIVVGSSNDKHIVDPSTIVSAGIEKDDIPSIDTPHFLSAGEASSWLSPDDLVVGLVYKGVVRAYPIAILAWHQIVNDTIAEDPILVSYCPLSDCASAYVRMLDGTPVEFGTSGRLYNSNLVMYDRQTQSEWSQFNGQALVGPKAGCHLDPVAVDVVSWHSWESAHPETFVLGLDTGFDRDYTQNPYATYYAYGASCFPLAAQDPCLSAQTVVYGIEVDGVAAAYCESTLSQRGTIDDRVGGVRIRIVKDSTGIVRVVNRSTGEEIAKTRIFWFAWYAFHPETKVYPDSTS